MQELHHEVSNMTLFQSIKILGEKTNKSYVILKVDDQQFKVGYANTLYCQLTGYNMTELLNQPYHSLFANDNTSKLSALEEKIRLGELTKVDISLNIKFGLPHIVDVIIIPVQFDLNSNLYTLLIFEEYSQSYLSQTLRGIEEKIYIALEQEKTLFKKLQIICDGLDAAFNYQTFPSIFIKENDTHQTIQMVMGQRFGLLEPYRIVQKVDREYYNKLINETESHVGNSIDAIQIHKLHQRIIETNKLTMSCIIPIKNHSNERIGIIVIYIDRLFPNNLNYREFIHKINDLISIAYIYEQKLKEISFLAYNDVPTGLPNRLRFTNRLEVLEQKQCYGFIHILVPGEFTEIVELYGREAGDELLEQLSKKIKMLQRTEEDYIGRYSSSKLILFTHHIEGEKKVDFEAILGKLVETPYVIQNNPVYITLKSGIAPVNEKISYKDSIRFAENTLSKAKKRAGNVVVYYQGEIDEQLSRNLIISSHLTEAVKNKEIEVYFQAKWNLKDDSINSIEALARWNSRALGFVSPMEFMSVAEKTGLVRDIDLQVIEQVLQWFKNRLANHKPVVPVAVNVSPEHFYHPSFVARLKELVDDYEVDSSNIIIEITENMSLVDLSKARQILQDLKNSGFRTSVDDFGMGYSALNYLQELSFSEMKIDRNFTMKLHDKGTYAIVKAILQIAQALNIETVAEGIETQEQARILQELGCDIGQGYLYYKPISIRDFEEQIEL
nr:EAL domain-containing protein [Lysinibacillus timonensis]